MELHWVVHNLRRLQTGVCEQRPPLGNLRARPFMEIWRSHIARQVRTSIRDRECYCTNEIFMWPSIIFQPAQLLKSLLATKAWQRAAPLRGDERADYTESASALLPPSRARADAPES